MKEIFNTQYTEIIHDGVRYFETNKEEEMKDIIKDYYISIKEVDKEDFLIGDIFLEEQ